MSSDEGSVQARISGFWSAVASHYESHPGNTVAVDSEAYGHWVRLFERTLPPPPADVLDLGTGTGFAALISASLGHRVLGVDLAPGMLAVARRLAADRGLDVGFTEADAVTPDLGEAAFDAITCRHLLWTLRDAEAAFLEWRRLLRPGGRVVVFDSLRPRQDPSAEPDEDDVFGRHYTPSVQAAIPFMHIEDHAPLVEAFRRAGYSDLAIESLPRHFAEEDEEDARPYVLIAHG